MRQQLLQIRRKVRPTNGFSKVLYLGLVALLPLITFVLVRLNFFGIAVAVVLLSKWRMFAVKPRFWASNIRANSVDIIVGVSLVTFTYHSGSLLFQALWTIAYIVWLIAIKPGTSKLLISAQAFIGQLCGLTAIYLVLPDGSSFELTLLTGLVCFLVARHFFDSFNEPYARMLSFIWGYFGAALAWVLGHWLLYYGQLAQPTLLLSALGYGMAVIYYLDHFDRLSKGLRRQFVLVMIAVVLVVLTFSDWGDKIVG